MSRWPFSSDSSDDSSGHTRRRLDEINGALEDEKEETVEVTVTKEKSYTEHTATATYVNGETEEYVFDKMNRDGNAIVLKDYTGVYQRMTDPLGSVMWRLGGEKFATISLANLQSFVTDEREKKTLEYETTEEKPKSEVEGDD